MRLLRTREIKAPPQMLRHRHHQNLTATALAGGTDYVVAPKPVCIAFVSHADHACRGFGGSMNRLMSEHPAVTFAKVDVESEEAAMLAKEQGIDLNAQLPRFKLYKNGLPIAPDVVGSDARALKHALEEVEKTAS